MQDDSTFPATKGDVQAVKADVQAVKADVQAVKADIRDLIRFLNKRFTRIDERFASMEDHIDKVLGVLVNVDKRLTGRIDNHEIRIKRLEKVAA